MWRHSRHVCADISFHVGLHASLCIRAVHFRLVRTVLLSTRTYWHITITVKMLTQILQFNLLQDCWGWREQIIGWNVFKVVMHAWNLGIVPLSPYDQILHEVSWSSYNLLHIHAKQEVCNRVMYLKCMYISVSFKNYWLFISIKRLWSYAIFYLTHVVELAYEDNIRCYSIWKETGIVRIWKYAMNNICPLQIQRRYFRFFQATRKRSF